MAETPTPASFYVEQSAPPSPVEVQPSTQSLEAFLDSLRSGTLGTALETYLSSLPTGESVTFRINFHGAGGFEVKLAAGSTLEQIISLVIAEFRTSAESAASSAAGVSVTVDTASAERVIDDTFRSSAGDSLRGLKLTVSGSAMGQSQSRTIEIVSYSFEMSDGSRVSFSVLNPEGEVIMSSESVNIPIVSSSSEALEDEVTILDGLVVAKGSTFEFNGNTYLFSGIDADGKPSIFRHSERGALLPLSEEEVEIFARDVRVDHEKNELILPTPVMTALDETTASMRTEVLTLPERGTTVLEIGQLFDLSGIAATFSVERSGSSYNLVLHRLDSTIVIGTIAGGRVTVSVGRQTLEDFEEFALSTLRESYSITINGPLDGEEVRIRNN